jgi:RNase P subunit RPR2
MERCPDCRAPLEVIDYIEATLWGDLVHTLVRFCLSCGWTDRTDTHLEIPAGV